MSSSNVVTTFQSTMSGIDNRLANLQSQLATYTDAQLMAFAANTASITNDFMYNNDPVTRAFNDAIRQCQEQRNATMISFANSFINNSM
jgi:hypothetical protein